MAHWLASPTSITAGCNRFTREENINPLFVSCGGLSLKKPCRERQEAQLYYFCGRSAPNADSRLVLGQGRESCLRPVEISSVYIVCSFGLIPEYKRSMPPASFQGQIPYHQPHAFERQEIKSN